MNKFIQVSVLSLLALARAAPALSSPVANTGVTRLDREIGHELLMLPRYTVFDDVEYRIEGSNVILTGEVIRPGLKDAAERVVKGIEGVGRVENGINVLPTSAVDDQIRLAAFRAIYGDPAFSRYAHQAIPPIHIIVENGRITLEGVVATEADRSAAYMKALELPGVFSVINRLKTER